LDPNFLGIKPTKFLPGGTPIGVFKNYINGKLNSSSNQFLTGSPSGSLTGERVWDCINPGPPYRIGGPFYKIGIDIPSSQMWDLGTVSNLGKPGITPGNHQTYTGKFYPGDNWGADSTSAYFVNTVPTLSGYDTLAWEKLKPHVSQASLMQSLVELRDLPRQLETSANLLYNSWRSFGGGYAKTIVQPQNIADNFLNHEFGWVPFLSDLQKLYSLSTQLESYISQTARDNNTWIRKRATLESSDTDELLAKTFTPDIDPWGENLQQMCESRTVDGISCKGFSEVRRRTRKRVWATGEFKYYRPEFDDNLLSFSGQFQNINRLITIYGLRINPTVIWKLTPWSWAIDWFTHVGDFIEHHDEFINDGIISRNLFIMRSEEKFTTKTSVAFFYSGTRSWMWQRKFSTKQRKVADSPYGFDRPWSSLTPRQWAILAAAGMSRGSAGFVSHGA